MYGVAVLRYSSNSDSVSLDLLGLVSERIARNPGLRLEVNSLSLLPWTPVSRSPPPLPV